MPKNSPWEELASIPHSPLSMSMRGQFVPGAKRPPQAGFSPEQKIIPIRPGQSSPTRISTREEKMSLPRSEMKAMANRNSQETSGGSVSKRENGQNMNGSKKNRDKKYSKEVKSGPFTGKFRMNSLTENTGSSFSQARISASHQLTRMNFT